MPDADPGPTLKPIRAEAIPRALLKAERYRLLNEPREAESICRDILAADPSSQPAMRTLVLAITDQFGDDDGARPPAAQEILPRLTDPRERAYMEGVIGERWAKALLRAGTPGHVVYDWVRQAMACFEAAERLSPPGDDDAVLRWNTCVRLLRDNPSISRRPEDDLEEERGAFDDLSAMDPR